MDTMSTVGNLAPATLRKMDRKRKELSALQVERDRGLALEYVRSVNQRFAIAELADKHQMTWKTVRRAVLRQLEWAKSHEDQNEENSHE